MAARGHMSEAGSLRDYSAAKNLIKVDEDRYILVMSTGAFESQYTIAALLRSKQIIVTSIDDLSLAVDGGQKEALDLARACVATPEAIDYARGEFVLLEVDANDRSRFSRARTYHQVGMNVFAEDAGNDCARTLTPGPDHHLYNRLGLSPIEARRLMAAYSLRLRAPLVVFNHETFEITEWNTPAAFEAKKQKG
jgi:hypothetical protein